jgi:hypothetical protein
MPIAATSTVSLTERFHEMFVGPMVGSFNLKAAITRKTGPDRLRIWQLSFTNAGNAAAQRGRLNSFTLVPTTEGTGCQAKLLLPTPLPFGQDSQWGQPQGRSARGLLAALPRRRDLSRLCDLLRQQRSGCW